MNRDSFEELLDRTAFQLGNEIRESTQYHDPKAFETRVGEVMQQLGAECGIEVTPSFHPHAFPDIKANGFGVEVKATKKDTWLSVGNSIFEGMRDEDVELIYIMFGKMGGMPSVRWGRYEDRITHVRISHAPRFVIEMDRDSPLFCAKHIPLTYKEFAGLSPVEKMGHVRQYSRGRLKPGERLWWLEDDPDETGLPLHVQMYRHLPDEQKRKLRAEGAFLCPQICQHGRIKGKYDDVTLYLLTRYGVFAPQTRDLFSAGSVAGPARGGNYLQRALVNIQAELWKASQELDDSLLKEYWHVDKVPPDRVKFWLNRADHHARGWVPSAHLFLDG